MDFLKEYKTLIIILLASLITRTIFFFYHQEVWWDSAVYIGMGKYIFSSGTIGMWEYFRPPLWPLLLGMSWKIGINPMIFGKIAILLCSLGIILITYILSKKFFDENTAIISSIIVSFIPVFFNFSHVLNNTIPSVFLSMVSIYLFTSKMRHRYLLSGLFAGLAFLTRFPQGILVAAFFIYLYFSDKKRFFIGSLLVAAGFIIAIAPFLASNQLMYDDMLKPFIGADQIMKDILATAPQENKENLYYLKNILKESFIIPFVILGAYFILRKEKRISHKHTLLIAFLLLVAYYQYLSFKEMRYIISYLPFIIIIATYGLLNTFKRRMKIVYVIAAVSLIVSLNTIATYVLWQQKEMTQRDLMFAEFSDDRYKSSTLFSTTPLPCAYSDLKLVPLYMVPHSKIKDIVDSVGHNSQAHILFSYEDMPCPKSDPICLSDAEHTFSFISSNNDLIFKKEIKGATYYLFLKNPE